MPLTLFLSSSLGWGFFLLLLFAVLQWFQIPAGNFLDWIIGGASFWWLAVVVTVPWNIHFQAKEVLAETAESQKKGIAIAPENQTYAQTLAQRALWSAIALHLISAIGLYILAAAGISQLGYLSSGAALLLTGLRPAIASYHYWTGRLQMIRREARYPREDIASVQQRLQTLENSISTLERQLDPDNESSWVARHQRFSQETRQALAQSVTSLERLKAENISEHDRLTREAQSAIAQLSSDSQFLEHVREIIRFFKAA